MTQRKTPAKGKQKVTNIGCGRINLAKPSTRTDPPPEPPRTELAKLIEQYLPKNNP
jgi:hypothetical protein